MENPMLSPNQDGTSGILYEDSLIRYLLLKASLLVGGLFIFFAGFYFFLAILLSFAGLNLWFGGADPSGRIISFLGSILFMIIGPLILIYEVLPMRRLVVSEERIRLPGSSVRMKPHQDRKMHVLHADEIVGVEMEVGNPSEFNGPYPAEWKCTLFLHNGKEFAIYDGSVSGDSDKCFLALKDFCRLNHLRFGILRRL
jgi:hypothetical protein